MYFDLCLHLFIVADFQISAERMRANLLLLDNIWSFLFSTGCWLVGRSKGYVTLYETVSSSNTKHTCCNPELSNIDLN